MHVAFLENRKKGVLKFREISVIFPLSGNGTSARCPSLIAGQREPPLRRGFLNSEKAGIFLDSSIQKRREYFSPNI